MMYRKQILVDEETRQNLLWLAEYENASESKVVRDLIIKKAKVKMKNAIKINAVEMMLKSARRLEKLGFGGAADSSINDDYIYR